MRTFKHVALPALLLALVASGSGANPGDPRVVQGVLAWTPGGERAPFVVVRGDDGRHYVADLSGAQWRGEPVKVGERVSLAGVEGVSPWQMSARVVGPGDSALAALSTPPGSPPAPSATTAPVPAPAEPAPRPWRRIQGTIDAVTDTTLRLREIDGRTVTVDVSHLSGGVKAILRPGDRATVFAVAADDRRLVAVGFVGAEPVEASASPRPPR